MNNKSISVIGPLLLIAAVFNARYDVLANDFANGFLIGVSIVMSCYMLVQFGKSRRGKAA